jgi:serine/threonine protein kinase
MMSRHHHHITYETSHEHPAHVEIHHYQHSPGPSSPPRGPKRSSVSFDKNTATEGLSYSDDRSSQEEELYLSDAIAQRLVMRTELKVSQNMAKSRFVRDHCRLYKLPRFSSDDLEIGCMIAKGGFSNVHAVAAFRRDSDVSFRRPSQPNTLYVIKHLNPKLALSNSKKLLSGARDLFWEAHLLSSFNHKHILKLRGWSAEGVGGFVSTGRADGFFLIFDRLEGTLFQRLSQWRRRARDDELLHAIHRRKKYPETMKLFIQRIKVARDVADAFSYLHDSCNVFHLDLKPGNVGFSADGCLKIFDFGLAVEVQPETDSPDETFDLNGKKGTSRYM